MMAAPSRAVGVCAARPGIGGGLRLAHETLDVQPGLAGDIDSLLESSLSGKFWYTKLQAGTRNS